MTEVMEKTHLDRSDTKDPIEKRLDDLEKKLDEIHKTLLVMYKAKLES